MNVSVLILTYNEEDNLPRCLDSVSWCDDILVIDSGSTDQTVEIAKARGAKVLERPFDNFADQRNFGLDSGELKHPWVFHLDADECVRDDLREEILSIAQSNPDKAYRVASRTYFRGAWIKRSSMYPCYQVRFGKQGHLRFKMVGHGQREILPADEVAALTHDLDHYSFSKGIDNWIEKHNRYSSDEAKEVIAGQDIPITWKNIIGKDSILRRRELKRLASRLPFKPLLRFVYIFFFRFGFMDGIAGFEYAKMLAMYEQMTVLKISEAKHS